MKQICEHVGKFEKEVSHLDLLHSLELPPHALHRVPLGIFGGGGCHDGEFEELVLGAFYK